MKNAIPHHDVQQYFEGICTDCLMHAVDDYLHQASHRQLRALRARVYLMLANPCTELCEEDCDDDPI